jgi:hypothetical protein
MKKVKKVIKSKKKAQLIEPALLSEAALAKDWNRAEEEKVWDKFEKGISEAFEKTPSMHRIRETHGL